MNDNVTYLIPPGNIRCYITGKLRKDTPEENVRQRWARSLVDEYGYSKNDIMLEYPVRMGTAKKRADIVVFKAGGKEQEDIVIIIETKREDVKASDKNKGEEQLKSYMAASSSCKYGLWVGKERFAFEKLPDGGVAPVSDIPRAGEEKPRRPERKDLQVVHDLTSVFRRCHNYIHANGGLQKAEAFHEMLKLIFCKMYDEEEGPGVELTFAVDPKEQRSESGRRRLLEDRIRPLFIKVKERYPYIFEEDEQIKLEPSVLAYIVSEMQFISLIDTEIDVKGAAYEEIVGQNLRGDRGEYFTPRNVCDMAVRIIQSLFSEEALTNLTVMDCCCGTGGFIVSWIDNLRHVIRKQEERRESKNIESKVRDRIREACTRHLFGLDINPFLVRTAQMNLVMHGDGSTNVFRVDSTRSPGEWSDDARKKVPFGKADVVLTNPPFGVEVKIDDAHILDRYELSRWESQNPRAALPAEQLFVETAMMYLKGGGILGIVLPDGILNNPGLRFLRSWLLKRGRILASIDLPKETFSNSGGVNNPSVLIVQKFTKEQIQHASAGIIDESHMVFMATPNTAGIDKRGKPIYLRHPDGREIIDDEGNRFRDDEIAAVAQKFIDWHINNSLSSEHQ
ncbi:MAG: N-6 DNA methylase [Deltaproteobacteria bacterium]|nr:N-6 DNA methylase [Deltaproteobacteria bacterium]